MMNVRMRCLPATLFLGQTNSLFNFKTPTQRKMNNISFSQFSVIILFILLPWHQVTAAVVHLDFEGLNDFESVNEFYDGGLGGGGIFGGGVSGPGPDLGVTFSPLAIALRDSDAGGTGNIGNEPSGENVLVCFSCDNYYLNVSDGFTDGLAFFYASHLFTGTVSVFSGLNGTGDLLTTVSLVALGAGPGDPTGDFSIWAPVGVTFSGVARSIEFGGEPDEYVVDNITLGSSVPVPEPSLGFFLGLAVCGYSISRRRL